jgi:hypothetical protein
VVKSAPYGGPAVTLKPVFGVAADQGQLGAGGPAPPGPDSPRKQSRSGDQFVAGEGQADIPRIEGWVIGDHEVPDAEFVVWVGPDPEEQAADIGVVSHAGASDFLCRQLFIPLGSSSGLTQAGKASFEPGGANASVAVSLGHDNMKERHTN